MRQTLFVVAAATAAVILVGRPQLAHAQQLLTVLPASVTTTTSGTYTTTVTVRVYSSGIVIGGGNETKVGAPYAYTGDGCWAVVGQTATSITWRLTRQVGSDGVWLRTGGAFGYSQFLALNAGSTLTLDTAHRQIILVGSVSKPYSSQVRSVIKF